MKSFKQYIKEGPNDPLSTWGQVSWSILSNNNFFWLPLSSKILERALGRNRRITALHVMDPESIFQLVKLQNSSKSISTFTEYRRRPMTLVKTGIESGGGAVVEVEGDILLNYQEDAYTEVDSQGRRWFNPFDFKVNDRRGAEKHLKIYKKKLNKLFYKDIISAYDKIKENELNDDPPNIKRIGPTDDEKVKFYFDNMITKQEKAKIIKKYYDFADKMMRDEHDRILEPFFYSVGASSNAEYNEIVLNKIKIKKLYIYDKYLEGYKGYDEFLKNKKIEYETFSDNGKVIRNLFNRIQKEFRKIFK